MKVRFEPKTLQTTLIVLTTCASWHPQVVTILNNQNGIHETNYNHKLEWESTLSPLSTKSTTLLSFRILSSPSARANICCKVIRLMTLVTGSPRSAAGVNVSNLMYLNFSILYQHNKYKPRNLGLYVIITW